MKKDVIITILAVLLLCLGGYLVYDKVIGKEDVPLKEEQNNEQDLSNDVTIEQKDAAYFDEYLKMFTSTCNGRHITRNTENFTSKDISYFVLGYYNMFANDNGMGEINYKVAVSDVDALIYKYFNKNNVVLETHPYGNDVSVITKQDNVYNFEWSAVGCSADRQVNPVVTYNGKNVTVKYELYADLCENKEDCGLTGKYITYHLKYNNGNYNIIKIEG